MTNALKPLSNHEMRWAWWRLLWLRGSERDTYLKRRDLRQKEIDFDRAQSKLKREVAKEALLYADILTNTWTRRRAAHLARGADISTNGKPVRRAKVQRVQFEEIRPTTDFKEIWYKLYISKQGLFGSIDMLPYGVDVSELISEEAIYELERACKRRLRVEDSDPASGTWIIVERTESLKGLPTLVHYSDVLPAYADKNMAQADIIIGVGRNSTMHSAKLAKYPHWLVGGSAGGGKSNMLKVIISTLLRFTSADDLQICFIDLKTLEFVYYDEVPHLYGGKIITDSKSASKVFDDLLEEHFRRVEVMKRRATEIAEFNRKYPSEKLKRIVVIMDEAGELFATEPDKKLREHNIMTVTRLTALGRATGIHVIACTQRPGAEFVPMQIKANMAVVISGYVSSGHHSRTMFDTDVASHIERLPGRMVYKAELDTYEVQVPLITEDDRDMAVKIAIGKAKGLIRLRGIDPEIVPDALMEYMVKEREGSLSLGEVSGHLYQYAIDQRMFKAWVADVNRQRAWVVDGVEYQVINEDKKYRLVPAVQPQPVAESEKTIEPAEVIPPTPQLSKASEPVLVIVNQPSDLAVKNALLYFKRKNGKAV